MAKAKPGLRVTDQYGCHGTIQSVIGHIAKVKWDDGTHSQVPASTIHKTGGPGWAVYFVFALLLGLTIAVGVWMM